MKEKEIDALLDELREEKINPRVYYYPAELALYSKVTVPTILRYCEQKKIKYKKIWGLKAELRMIKWKNYLDFLNW